MVMCGEATTVVLTLGIGRLHRLLLTVTTALVISVEAGQHKVAEIQYTPGEWQVAAAEKNSNMCTLNRHPTGPCQRSIPNPMRLVPCSPGPVSLSLRLGLANDLLSASPTCLLPGTTTSVAWPSSPPLLCLDPSHGPMPCACCVLLSAHLVLSHSAHVVL